MLCSVSEHYCVDSNVRSLAKAISYRLLGSMATACMVYVFSQDLKVSLGVGAFDIVTKICLYWAHERLWNYIPFGRQEPRTPDYEI
jgi:uncharacterized membrane protein